MSLKALADLIVQGPVWKRFERTTVICKLRPAQHNGE